MLAIVLVIAALMRLAYPGIVEFKHDEAYLSLLALDALAAGTLPVLGMPSSVGLPNAPASVWLLMIPYKLTNNPLVATMFVALLNVAGVGLLFVLARRLFDRHVAFMAALLYAVNLWAVVYSRKIWAQDMHTPLLLLALWFGLLGFMDGRRVFQVLALPVLLLALQIHYAGWALLPLIAWFLIVGRKQIVWGSLTLSVVLAVGVMVPFGVGIWQAVQQNPDLVSSLRSRDGGTGFSPDAVGYNFQLAMGAGWLDEIAPTIAESATRLVGGVQGAVMVGTGAVMLAGLIASVRSEHPMANRLLVLLWAGLPIAVFSWQWTQVFVHYFVASIPAWCLLGGLSATWVFRVTTDKHRRNAIYRVRPILGTAFGVLITANAVVWLWALSQIASNPTLDTFGTPLARRLDARTQLGDADDVLLISDGYRTRYDEEAAAWSVLLHDDRCLRVVSGPNFIVWPASDKMMTIIEPDSPNRPEYTVGRFVTVLPYTVYTSDLSKTALPDANTVTFDSDVRLTGSNLDGNILQLQWQMPTTQPNLDLQYFAHFIDADGEKIGQRDADFLPGRFWCEGDTLITQIDVNAPPETASLRVGLYQLDPVRGFINASVIDETGAAIGTWGDVALP